MKPWGFRNPVLKWTLIVVSILFIVSGEVGTAVVGLVGLVIAYLLFGLPRFASRSLKATGRTDGAMTHSTIRNSVPPASPSGQRSSRDAASAMNRLAVLPNRTRMEIVNHFELDELPEFVLMGKNHAAVIGTDRRLFIIPEGRNGTGKLWSRAYESLTNARIENQRRGARLVLTSEQFPESLPMISLENDDQVDSGIRAVQGIRQRIMAAQRTQQERQSPPAQSAFVETANVSIPTRSDQRGLTLGDMLEMSPSEFETFTGRALEAMGYTSVRRVGGAGDLAADLTALDPQGRSAIVQCKRYTPGSKVGSPALQSFIGMKSIHHRVERGIFVTTADYSQQAIDLAKEHGIVLIDGDDLVKIAALVMTPKRTAPSQVSSINQYCANCGAQLRQDMNFCPSCGRDVASV